MSDHLLIQGDARSIPLADRSVHCVVTSPPYFGLRNYGVDRQIGNEPTPDEFVAAMVRVFREVWRVLRDDGTVWLNIGDSFCNAGSRNNGTGLDGNRRGGMATTDGTWAQAKEAHGDIRHALKAFGIKHKDLIGIPWMLAFALRADGWYLRSECIWHKPNPMPESVRDRPSKSHEQVFLLTKGERYYYDANAIREPMSPTSEGRYAYEFGGTKAAELTKAGLRTNPIGFREMAGGRNKRTVWTIPLRSFKGSHFATFPPKLVEPCIKAGTSKKGVCPACGSPWKRTVKSERKATRPGVDSKVYANPPLADGSPYHKHAGDICGNRDPQRHVSTFKTTGWKPTCSCDAGEPIPATVFDPFSGAATTGVVSLALGRRYVGIDLSAKYLAMSKRRIERPHVRHVGAVIDVAPLPLFASLTPEATP